MPLTDEQRNALPAVCARLDAVLIPFGTALSLDECARDFDPGSLPADVTVRIEIAPPSPQSHPLFPSNGLKTPECVPVYFFALSSDRLEADPGSDVIFFIHGRGNILGHPTHPLFANFFIQLLRTVASHMGDVRKCVLIVPSYRLTTVPENAFPAALQDLIAAYDHVLGKGYKPFNIIIAGDSAGENHAVMLTHLILQSDRSSPCGVIPIAPGAIQAYDQMSEYAKAQASHNIIGMSQWERMASAYVGNSGVARTDPLMSGAFIPFTASWPKTLILVDSADQLIDASHELERHLMAVKQPVELVEYDERPHGWWVLAHIFPDDIQDAAQRVARFLLH